ncbi:MAG: Asp-tRNA(Asn)/Glu-tRNA(Gln) amidotransferase subunit GatB [Burkholderiaceae bacterium]|nr:Asp-tRNA(Asn)/Glu-tRNA(Gln) amidotransferase subunit GatB [Burkholderiaceae bacterium]MDH3460793.1 Asp-tRNA(Asn)/Glu-tRNA(Gln) amidotransferase subunit GatB [Burkholderiaceae bacterium]
MTPLVRGFEVVIGIETHVQLSTASKIFSGASTAVGALPNTQACAVDLALPGTLPVLNSGAVERAICFGLAVGATIAPLSVFARKNYFYPDLPKGYQISQYEIPVVWGGVIEFYIAASSGSQKKVVHLTRAHLEEDAGKSLHEDYSGQTGIDLNRAGTPLLEVVTEPDMRSSAEAVEYARTLHALVVWLGICDGNMQEGSFRCDANVSVRKPGTPFGIRREIKNLNSFKFLQQAIDYEVQWQIDLIEDGGQVQQATVLFNADTGQTRVMRTKEDAHDYRYFPDPDLPPLQIAADWIERLRSTMPELPGVMAARLQQEFGLAPYDAAMVTQSKAFAAYFEDTVRACGKPKLVTNWLMGEVSRKLNAESIGIELSPVGPDALAQVISRVADGSLLNNHAKRLFELLWAIGIVSPDGSRSYRVPEHDNLPLKDTIDALVEAHGLKPMSDASALEKILDEVLAANTKSVDEYRAGKDKAFNALVGQTMKASKGQANPALVTELLKKKLV